MVYFVRCHSLSSVHTLRFILRHFIGQFGKWKSFGETFSLVNFYLRPKEKKREIKMENPSLCRPSMPVQPPSPSPSPSNRMCLPDLRESFYPTTDKRNKFSSATSSLRFFCFSYKNSYLGFFLGEAETSVCVCMHELVCGNCMKHSNKSSSGSIIAIIIDGRANGEKRQSEE